MPSIKKGRIFIIDLSPRGKNQQFSRGEYSGEEFLRGSFTWRRAVGAKEGTCNPLFGRSVNPMPTTLLSAPLPRFSDLPTALAWSAFVMHRVKSSYHPFWIFESHCSSTCLFSDTFFTLTHYIYSTCTLCFKHLGQNKWTYILLFPVGFAFWLNIIK